MSFDGIVTSAIVAELKSNILGGKIEKIYQPEKEQLFFFIHAKGKKHMLFISSRSNHSAFYLTDEKPLNPPDPGSFCMLLRKHIQSGKISEIKQRGTERIVDFYIETVTDMGFNTLKKLTVEIMGKHSNIILIDNNSNKIIDSIKRVPLEVNRYRQIFPGNIYIDPPSQDKVALTYDNLESSNNIEDSKTLMNTYQGISPQLADEIIREHTCGASMPDILRHIIDEVSTIENIVSTNENETNCQVYLDENNAPKEFHVHPLYNFKNFYKTVCFDTPSKAVKYYFSNRETSNIIRQKASDLIYCINSYISKLNLKKQRLLSDMQKAEKMDTYKLYGELLTCYMHTIKKSAESVVLFNYYDNENIKIPLDPLLDANKNAQNYFKKYNKSKTAKIEKAKQLDETQREIDYLESVLEYTKSADNIYEIDDLRTELTESGYLRRKKINKNKTKKKQEPYTYVTSDGFKVMAGHNNSENDFLTFKIAKNKDIWFHTKNIPGSHVVLFPEGNNVSETALFEAAALAAWHSKGKDSENVPVDYTLIKYVKKPAGAKPGMVIFTNNKTLYIKPKELKKQNHK